MMQVSSSMEDQEAGTVVKRLSVPIGLEELMTGLTKEVLQKKPMDIYSFAADHFAHLLALRDKGNYQQAPSKSIIYASKDTLENFLDTEKPPKSNGTPTRLSRQVSIRADSPNKRNGPKIKRSGTPKFESNNNNEGKTSDKQDKKRPVLSRRQTPGSKNKFDNLEPVKEDALKILSKRQSLSQRSTDRKSKTDFENTKDSKRSSPEVTEKKKRPSREASLKNKPSEEKHDSKECMDKKHGQKKTKEEKEQNKKKTAKETIDSKNDEKVQKSPSLGLQHSGETHDILIPAENKTPEKIIKSPALGLQHSGETHDLLIPKESVEEKSSDKTELFKVDHPDKIILKSSSIEESTTGIKDGRLTVTPPKILKSAQASPDVDSPISLIVPTLVAPASGLNNEQSPKTGGLKEDSETGEILSSSKTESPKKYDSLALREELQKVEEESKLNNFTSSYNPYKLKQEIKNASKEYEEEVDKGSNMPPLDEVSTYSERDKVAEFLKNEKGYVASVKQPESLGQPENNKLQLLHGLTAVSEGSTTGSVDGTSLEHKDMPEEEYLESNILKKSSTPESVKSERSISIGSSKLQHSGELHDQVIPNNSFKGNGFSDEIIKLENYPKVTPTLGLQHSGELHDTLITKPIGGKDEIGKQVDDNMTKLIQGLENPADSIVGKDKHSTEDIKAEEENNRKSEISPKLSIGETITQAASKIQAGVRGFLTRKLYSNKPTEKKTDEKKLSDQEIEQSLSQLDGVPVPSESPHTSRHKREASPIDLMSIKMEDSPGHKDKLPRSKTVQGTEVEKSVLPSLFRSVSVTDSALSKTLDEDEEKLHNSSDDSTSLEHTDDLGIGSDKSITVHSDITMKSAEPEKILQETASLKHSGELHDNLIPTESKMGHELQDDTLIKDVRHSNELHDMILPKEVEETLQDKDEPSSNTNVTTNTNIISDTAPHVGDVIPHSGVLHNVHDTKGAVSEASTNVSGPITKELQNKQTLVKDNLKHSSASDDAKDVVAESMDASGKIADDTTLVRDALQHSGELHDVLIGTEVEETVQNVEDVKDLAAESMEGSGKLTEDKSKQLKDDKTRKDDDLQHSGELHDVLIPTEVRETIQEVQDNKDLAMQSIKSNGKLTQEISKQIKDDTTLVKDAPQHSGELHDVPIPTEVKEPTNDVPDVTDLVAERVDVNSKLPKNRTYHIKDDKILTKDALQHSGELHDVLIPTEVKETIQNIEDDKDLAAQSVEVSGKHTEDISKQVNEDIKSVKDALQHSGELHDVPIPSEVKETINDVKDVKDLVTERVDASGKLVHNISEQLKDDKILVKDTLQHSGELHDILIPTEVKENINDVKDVKDLVAEKVDASGNLAHNVSEQLKDHKTLVKDALQHSGELHDIPIPTEIIETINDVKDVKDLVPEKVAASGKLAHNVSERLKDDKTLVTDDLQHSGELHDILIPIEVKETINDVNDVKDLVGEKVDASGKLAHNVSEQLKADKTLVKDALQHSGELHDILIPTEVKETINDVKDVKDLVAEKVDASGKLAHNISEQLKDDKTLVKDALQHSGELHDILIPTEIKETINDVKDVKDLVTEKGNASGKLAHNISEKMKDDKTLVKDALQHSGELHDVPIPTEVKETINDVRDVKDLVAEKLDASGKLAHNISEQLKDDKTLVKDALQHSGELHDGLIPTKVKETIQDVQDNKDLTAQSIEASGKLIEEIPKQLDDTNSEVKQTINDMKDLVAEKVDASGKLAHNISEPLKDDKTLVKDALQHSGELHDILIPTEIKETINDVKDVKDLVTEKGDASVKLAHNISEQMKDDKTLVKDALQHSGELHDVPIPTKVKETINDVRDVKDLVAEKLDASGKLAHNISEQLKDDKTLVKDALQHSGELHDGLIPTKVKETIQDVQDNKDLTAQGIEANGKLIEEIPKQIDDTNSEVKETINDMKDLVAEKVDASGKLAHNISEQLKDDKTLVKDALQHSGELHDILIPTEIKETINDVKNVKDLEAEQVAAGGKLAHNVSEQLVTDTVQHSGELHDILIPIEVKETINDVKDVKDLVAEEVDANGKLAHNVSEQLKDDKTLIKDAFQHSGELHDILIPIEIKKTINDVKDVKDLVAEKVDASGKLAHNISEQLQDDKTLVKDALQHSGELHDVPIPTVVKETINDVKDIKDLVAEKVDASGKLAHNISEQLKDDKSLVKDALQHSGELHDVPIPTEVKETINDVKDLVAEKVNASGKLAHNISEQLKDDKSLVKDALQHSGELHEVSIPTEVKETINDVKDVKDLVAEKVDASGKLAHNVLEQVKKDKTLVKDALQHSGELHDVLIPTEVKETIQDVQDNKELAAQSIKASGKLIEEIPKQIKDDTKSADVLLHSGELHDVLIPTEVKKTINDVKDVKDMVAEEVDANSKLAENISEQLKNDKILVKDALQHSGELHDVLNSTEVGETIEEVQDNKHLALQSIEASGTLAEDISKQIKDDTNSVKDALQHSGELRDILIPTKVKELINDGKDVIAEKVDANGKLAQNISEQLKNDNTIAKDVLQHSGELHDVPIPTEVEKTIQEAQDVKDLVAQSVGESEKLAEDISKQLSDDKTLVKDTPQHSGELHDVLIPTEAEERIQEAQDIKDLAAGNVEARGKLKEDISEQKNDNTKSVKDPLQQSGKLQDVLIPTHVKDLLAESTDAGGKLDVDISEHLKDDKVLVKDAVQHTGEQHDVLIPKEQNFQHSGKLHELLIPKADIETLQDVKDAKTTETENIDSSGKLSEEMTQELQDDKSLIKDILQHSGELHDVLISKDVEDKKKVRESHQGTTDLVGENVKAKDILSEEVAEELKDDRALIKDILQHSGELHDVLNSFLLHEKGNNQHIVYSEELHDTVLPQEVERTVQEVKNSEMGEDSSFKHTEEINNALIPKLELKDAAETEKSVKSSETALLETQIDANKKPTDTKIDDVQKQSSLKDEDGKSDLNGSTKDGIISTSGLEHSGELHDLLIMASKPQMEAKEEIKVSSARAVSAKVKPSSSDVSQDSGDKLDVGPENEERIAGQFDATGVRSVCDFTHLVLDKQVSPNTSTREADLQGKIGLQHTGELHDIVVVEAAKDEGTNDDIKPLALNQVQTVEVGKVECSGNENSLNQPCTPSVLAESSESEGRETITAVTPKSGLQHSILFTSSAIENKSSPIEESQPANVSIEPVHSKFESGAPAPPIEQVDKSLYTHTPQLAVVNKSAIKDSTEELIGKHDSQRENIKTDKESKTQKADLVEPGRDVREDKIVKNSDIMKTETAIHVSDEEQEDKTKNVEESTTGPIPLVPSHAIKEVEGQIIQEPDVPNALDKKYDSDVFDCFKLSSEMDINIKSSDNYQASEAVKAHVNIKEAKATDENNVPDKIKDQLKEDKEELISEKPSKTNAGSNGIENIPDKVFDITKLQAEIHEAAKDENENVKITTDKNDKGIDKVSVEENPKVTEINIHHEDNFKKSFDISKLQSELQEAARQVPEEEENDTKTRNHNFSDEVQKMAENKLQNITEIPNRNETKSSSFDISKLHAELDGAGKGTEIHETKRTIDSVDGGTATDDKMTDIINGSGIEIKNVEDRESKAPEKKLLEGDNKTFDTSKLHIELKTDDSISSTIKEDILNIDTTKLKLKDIEENPKTVEEINVKNKNDCKNLSALEEKSPADIKTSFDISQLRAEIRGEGKEEDENNKNSSHEANQPVEVQTYVPNINSKSNNNDNQSEESSASEAGNITADGKKNLFGNTLSTGVNEKAEQIKASEPVGVKTINEIPYVTVAKTHKVISGESHQLEILDNVQDVESRKDNEKETKTINKSEPSNEKIIDEEATNNISEETVPKKTPIFNISKLRSELEEANILKEDDGEKLKSQVAEVHENVTPDKSKTFDISKLRSELEEAGKIAEGSKTDQIKLAVNEVNDEPEILKDGVTGLAKSKSVHDLESKASITEDKNKKELKEESEKEVSLSNDEKTLVKTVHSLPVDDKNKNKSELDQEEINNDQTLLHKEQEEITEHTALSVSTGIINDKSNQKTKIEHEKEMNGEKMPLSTSIDSSKIHIEPLSLPVDDKSSEETAEGIKMEEKIFNESVGHPEPVTTVVDKLDKTDAKKEDKENTIPNKSMESTQIMHNFEEKKKKGNKDVKSVSNEGADIELKKDFGELQDILKSFLLHEKKNNQHLEYSGELHDAVRPKEVVQTVKDVNDVKDLDEEVIKNSGKLSQDISEKLQNERALTKHVLQRSGAMYDNEDLKEPLKPKSAASDNNDKQKSAQDIKRTDNEITSPSNEIVTEPEKLKSVDDSGSIIITVDKKDKKLPEDIISSKDAEEAFNSKSEHDEAIITASSGDKDKRTSEKDMKNADNNVIKSTSNENIKNSVKTISADHSVPIISTSDHNKSALEEEILNTSDNGVEKTLKPKSALSAGAITVTGGDKDKDVIILDDDDIKVNPKLTDHSENNNKTSLQDLNTNVDEAVKFKSAHSPSTITMIGADRDKQIAEEAIKKEDTNAKPPSKDGINEPEKPKSAEQLEGKLKQKKKEASTRDIGKENIKENISNNDKVSDIRELTPVISENRDALNDDDTMNDYETKAISKEGVIESDKPQSIDHSNNIVEEKTKEDSKSYTKMEYKETTLLSHEGVDETRNYLRQMLIIDNKSSQVSTAVNEIAVSKKANENDRDEKINPNLIGSNKTEEHNDEVSINAGVKETTTLTAENEPQSNSFIKDNKQEPIEIHTQNILTHEQSSSEKHEITHILIPDLTTTLASDNVVTPKVSVDRNLQSSLLDDSSANVYESASTRLLTHDITPNIISNENIQIPSKNLDKQVQDTAEIIKPTIQDDENLTTQVKLLNIDSNIKEKEIGKAETSIKGNAEKEEISKNKQATDDHIKIKVDEEAERPVSISSTTSTDSVSTIIAVSPSDRSKEERTHTLSRSTSNSSEQSEESKTDTIIDASKYKNEEQEMGEDVNVKRSDLSELKPKVDGVITADQIKSSNNVPVENVSIIEHADGNVINDVSSKPEHDKKTDGPYKSVETVEKNTTHMKQLKNKAEEQSSVDNTKDITVQESTKRTRDGAATTIQSSYRGYRVRKDLGKALPEELKPLNKEQNDKQLRVDSAKEPSTADNTKDLKVQETSKLTRDGAATTIQSSYRGYRVRKDLDKENLNAPQEELDPLNKKQNDKQLRVDSAKEPSTADNTKNLTAQETSKLNRDEAATTIQSSYRGYRVRKDLGKENLNALQRELEPPYKGQNEKQSRVDSAKEPSTVDNTKDITAKETSKLSKDEAATTIQSSYRGYQVRKDLGKEHLNIPQEELHLQNKRHNDKQLRVDSAKEESVEHNANNLRVQEPSKVTRDGAATTIQSNYRGYRVRKDLGKENLTTPLEELNPPNKGQNDKQLIVDSAKKESVEHIANDFTVQEPLKVTRDGAATTIQSNYRGYRVRSDLGKTNLNTLQEELKPPYKGQNEEQLRVDSANINEHKQATLLKDHKGIVTNVVSSEASKEPLENGLHLITIDTKDSREQEKSPTDITPDLAELSLNFQKPGGTDEKKGGSYQKTQTDNLRDSEPKSKLEVGSPNAIELTPKTEIITNKEETSTNTASFNNKDQEEVKTSSSKAEHLEESRLGSAKLDKKEETQISNISLDSSNSPTTVDNHSTVTSESGKITPQSAKHARTIILDKDLKDSDLNADVKLDKMYPRSSQATNLKELNLQNSPEIKNEDKAKELEKITPKSSTKKEKELKTSFTSQEANYTKGAENQISNKNEEDKVEITPGIIATAPPLHLFDPEDEYDIWTADDSFYDEIGASMDPYRKATAPPITLLEDTKDHSIIVPKLSEHLIGSSSDESIQDLDTEVSAPAETIQSNISIKHESAPIKKMEEKIEESNAFKEDVDTSTDKLQENLANLPQHLNSPEKLSTKNVKPIVQGEVTAKPLDVALNQSFVIAAPHADEKHKTTELLKNPDVLVKEPKEGTRSSNLNEIHAVSVIPALDLKQKDGNVKEHMENESNTTDENMAYVPEENFSNPKYDLVDDGISPRFHIEGGTVPKALGVVLDQQLAITAPKAEDKKKVSKTEAPQYIHIPLKGSSDDLTSTKSRAGLENSGEFHDIVPLANTNHDEETNVDQNKSQHENSGPSTFGFQHTVPSSNSNKIVETPVQEIQSEQETVHHPSTSSFRPTVDKPYQAIKHENETSEEEDFSNPKYDLVDSVVSPRIQIETESAIPKALGNILDQQLAITAPRAEEKKEGAETAGPEYIYIPLKDSENSSVGLQHSAVNDSVGTSSLTDTKKEEKLPIEETPMEPTNDDKPDDVDEDTWDSSNYNLYDADIRSKIRTEQKGVVPNVLGAVVDQQLAITAPLGKIKDKKRETVDPKYIHIPLKDSPDKNDITKTALYPEKSVPDGLDENDSNQVSDGIVQTQQEVIQQEDKNNVLSSHGKAALEEFQNKPFDKISKNDHYSNLDQIKQYPQDQIVSNGHHQASGFKEKQEVEMHSMIKTPEEIKVLKTETPKLDENQAQTHHQFEDTTNKSIALTGEDKSSSLSPTSLYSLDVTYPSSLSMEEPPIVDYKVKGLEKPEVEPLVRKSSVPVLASNKNQNLSPTQPFRDHINNSVESTLSMLTPSTSSLSLDQPSLEHQNMETPLGLHLRFSPSPTPSLDGRSNSGTDTSRSRDSLNSAREDRSMQSENSPIVIQTTQISDNSMPLAVQLNQAPGAAVLTSPTPNDDDDAGETLEAHASGKDVSTKVEGSKNRAHFRTSMETDKRKNATIKEKNMEEDAATKIQAGFRGYQVRKQLKLKNGGVESVRRSLRRKSSGKLRGSDKASKKASSKPSDLEEKSATKIQAGIRGFLVRRRQQKKGKNNTTPESS